MMKTIVFSPPNEAFFYREDCKIELSLRINNYEKSRGKVCEHKMLKLSPILYGCNTALEVYCMACSQKMGGDVLPKTHALIDEYTNTLEIDKLWKSVSGKDIATMNYNKHIRKIKRFISRRV